MKTSIHNAYFGSKVIQETPTSRDLAQKVTLREAKIKQKAKMGCRRDSVLPIPVMDMPPCL